MHFSPPWTARHWIGNSQQQPASLPAVVSSKLAAVIIHSLPITSIAAAGYVVEPARGRPWHPASPRRTHLRVRPHDRISKIAGLKEGGGGGLVAVAGLGACGLEPLVPTATRMPPPKAPRTAPVEPLHPARGDCLQRRAERQLPGRTPAAVSEPGWVVRRVGGSGSRARSNWSTWCSPRV
jgi:hypothetical protein